MTKQQAGQKGGLTTVRKYGKKYMREIGKKGAQRFHELYQLSPAGLANYAIVRRADNVIIGFSNQAHWR